MKRLGFFLLAGCAVFVALLVCLQALLVFVGYAVDPSFYNFYPILALLGAAFGFERWWAHEQGDVNPFHDR